MMKMVEWTTVPHGRNEVIAATVGAAVPEVEVDKVPRVVDEVKEVDHRRKTIPMTIKPKRMKTRENQLHEVVVVEVQSLHHHIDDQVAGAALARMRVLQPKRRKS